MHSYLRAIGFGSKIQKKQLRDLFDLVIESPDQMKIVQIDADNNIALYTKEIAPDMGLMLCGEMDENDQFQMDYYIPYLKSNIISSKEICSYKKQSAKESYAGICDDYRIGMTMIFYLTNFIEMKQAYTKSGYWLQNNGVSFSALSCSGKILLPVKKSMEQIESAKTASKKKISLLEEAKNGDVQAMERLTIDEMNAFSRMNKMVRKSDLYSLIDTYMVPNGVECDQYSIMAEICECSSYTNSYTGEKGYVMQLECNDIPIRVAIHADDLLGKPEVGRRFKGQIWMQGEVN